MKMGIINRSLLITQILSHSSVILFRLSIDSGRYSPIFAFHFKQIAMPFPRNAVASHFSVGMSGVIERFTNENLAGKLLDIGVRPGSMLRIIRKGPFGRSWYVKIDRHCVALRKQELACIKIK